MMSTFRDFARTSGLMRRIHARIAGLSRSNQTPAQSLAKLIVEMKAPVLLDVGANVGQFGIDIRNSGFTGKIISFEPVNSLFEKLKETSFKFQPWDTINKALGAHIHKSEINVSKNSGLSSSLLEISQSHLEAFPGSYTDFREVVDISTLDFEVDFLQLDLSETILKIDVQGFESKVIEGGKNSIPHIKYILLELSLMQLYYSEETFLTVLNLLHDLGHEVIDIHRGICSRTGSLLQVDVITKSTRG